MLFESYPNDIHCSSVVFRYPYRAKVLLQSTKSSYTKLPNPCHSVTSPLRGMPPSAVLQSGVPAASICLADLADADDAAPMRLENFGMSHILQNVV